MNPLFDWDNWNKQKSLLKHGITNREAESAYNDPHSKTAIDLKHRLKKNVIFALVKVNLEG
jgi:uncharacterized DUF497 family protein